MAIITIGPTVTGIRGTIGGNLFSANQSGPYIRAWSKGSNPKSNKQGAERSLFATIAQSWQDLSDAQRAGWDTAAANPINARTNSLGETYNLSGFGLYVSFNTRRDTVGLGLRLTAPTPISPAAPAGLDLEVRPDASGGSEIAFQEGPLGTSAYLVNFLSVTRSQGVAGMSTGFLLVKVIDFDDTSPIDITSEVEALYGDPVVGFKYFMETFFQVSGGARSAGVITEAVAF
jgi:hypothetical protein